MTETSKLKKYLMWYKVKELFSNGLKRTQISSVLGLHRQTVSKYLSMSEEEFRSSQSYDRHYGHMLDAYESFVVNELSLWPFLSAPQIHDRLRENFRDLPDVTAKTVFNFVSRIRHTHNIPKETEKTCRPYEKQAETPYGKYAQVDFGERWMAVEGGTSAKVYFFAMSLSRSRYKFLYFSKTPFTTALAVYAHELAFSFYGGIPEKIVYDQDKVFLVNENLGDLVLTKGFGALVREAGFEPVFCRKSDPESKGKIENVVKYVKYNFLRGRFFTDIETLNQAAMSWLERTGNGTLHHGMHKIPAEEFEMEQTCLKKYTGTPTPPAETLAPHHVRKDNVINFRGNYYAVPTGTYRGHGTTVYIEEKDDTLTIYSPDTGKVLASHPISPGRGVLVSNTSLRRDRQSSLEEYERQVSARLPKDDIVELYLSQLRIHKARNLRDNLQYIDRRASLYSPRTLAEAMRRCHEASVYNGKDLMCVAESIRIERKEALLEPKPEVRSLPRQTADNMEPERTDISSFNRLFA